jgi:large subunit ribosomal protein L6
MGVTMSRLAKLPVVLPEGVTFGQSGQTVTITGGGHELSAHIPAERVQIKASGQELMVTAKTDAKADRAASGLVHNLLANLVQGVGEPFSKELEFAGVGFRAAVSGDKVVLNMGYSHPVELEIPKGISVSQQKNVLKVSGADRQGVGQFAANIRAVRPPEPYKGKGIHYVDEHVRRKAGKAGKAAA